MKVPVKRKAQQNHPRGVVKEKKAPAKHYFKKGNSGRPKGIPNKFTTLKQAFLDAFEELGGVQGLVAWAKRSNSNRGVFYNMLKSMLPRDVVLQNPGENPENLPLIVRIEAREKTNP